MTSGNDAVEPIVDRRQQDRLRPAAALPGHRDAGRIHVGKTRHEVQRAHAVPRLQPHVRLQAQHRVGVRESFAMDERLAVGVADHVVMKDDEAEAREVGRPRLQRIAGRFGRPLGPLAHERLDVLLGPLQEAAVLPVAVRREHGRPLALATHRPIEVPRHVVTGRAGKEHLFDRVTVAIDAAVDYGRQRRTDRHGPQADGDEHLRPQGVPPRQPLLSRLELRRERERMIEIVPRRQPYILPRWRRTGFPRLPGRRSP